MSVEHQKVSRLPPLPKPLDPVMQEIFDNSRARGGSVINLQVATGHAPKFAQASRAMAFVIRFEAETPRRAARTRHHAHRADRRLGLRTQPAHRLHQEVRL